MLVFNPGKVLANAQGYSYEYGKRNPRGFFPKQEIEGPHCYNCGPQYPIWMFNHGSLLIEVCRLM